MTKFTPAPWVAIVPKERSYYKGTDITSYGVMSEKTRGELREAGLTHYRRDDKFVDNVDITSTSFVRDMLLEEAQANAHLIAAAPEMYEALSLLEKLMTEYKDDFRMEAKDLAVTMIVGEMIEKARNSLAKARGESGGE